MGNKAPRYRIEREIGRGAFGNVFLADDSRLGRKVALKFLSIPEGITDDERQHLIARFEREAKAAAGLSHPNIVIIHDISEAGGRYFISMEFLEGRPLSAIIREGPVSPERALGISCDVLSALEYSHEKGVVHRDIKPDNIFVLEDGTVKLVDFGLSRVKSASTITKTGAVMGSPGYLAPEIIEGGKADERSDIFSFGVVLYEMLCGARPFGPDSPTDSLVTVLYRIVHEEPVPPAERVPSLPPELDAVLMQCLAKDSGDRFQNVSALRKSLSTAASRLTGKGDEATLQPGGTSTSGALELPRSGPPAPDRAPPEASSREPWAPPPRMTAGPTFASAASPGGWRKHVLALSISLVAVVLAAVVIVLVSLFFTGNADEARKRCRAGDALMTSVEAGMVDCGNSIRSLGDELESMELSSDDYEQRAAEIYQSIKDLEDKLKKAKAEYKSVLGLRGLSGYKEYARLRLESIEDARAYTSRAVDVLAYMKDIAAALESGDTGAFESLIGDLDEHYTDLDDLKSQYDSREKRAKDFQKAKAY